MKRQIAMLAAGMISTLAVVGGTIAAAQSGAFGSSSTTIQPNAEITVPEVSPTLEQQAYTVVETRTIVVTAQPQPTSTAESTTVMNQDPSERETMLLARLNQAYGLLKQRDAEYQTRLKEAYDRLKATSASVETSTIQTSAPAASSSTSAQAAAVSPASAAHTEDHPDATAPQQEDKSQTGQSSSSQPEGQDH
jgi:hypothetical protein